MPSRSLSLRIFGAIVLLFATSLIASHTPGPTAVTVAGSLQSELGCSDDWQPGCAATHLGFDAQDLVWQRTFDVPAGNWEYKAPLSDSWDENYGANAERNGANIGLNLAAAKSVKFYYDHKTHWIADNHNKVIAVAPGSFQSELGCAGDWDPTCLRSWLQDPDGDGTYSFAARLPVGDYFVKVAINESWAENYGQGGAQNGADIPFSVGADCTETVFSYNAATHVLSVTGNAAPPQPSAVGIPGSYQSEVGCSGDWQPECAATHLVFDANDSIWQRTFNIPAGNYLYKAALNNSWDENYGANASRNGADIPLNLASDATVKFYYDHRTHWVADNRNKIIATAAGSFQSELGCSADWDPTCLRSWLQDPDGDGTYTFSTRSLAAGNYAVKVTINESWDENYGAGGVRNGADIAFTVPNACVEVFFSYNATTHVLTVGAAGAPRGNLNKAQAHWVNQDTIAWNLSGLESSWSVKLHYAAAGGLTLQTSGVDGGTSIPLTYDSAGLDAATRAKFPHLASYEAFRIPASRAGEIAEALKSQLAVSAADSSGNLADATSLQIPGALDALYTYNGALGATFDSGVPTLRVWAPTARSVKLHLFNDANPATPVVISPMTVDQSSGVWRITGNSSWYGKYYLYEVEVFVRSTGQVEHNLVSDPYSVSLSLNSARSQIVDLSQAALKPAGWDAFNKPRLDAPEDIALYELHVRDFSANDTTVPAVQRGTYKAFALPTSNGILHLRSLAAAGLTHVHLLPSFDIASVNEDKSQWQTPGDLSGYPPDSEEQQSRVMAVASNDAFNWGYDPWHYAVPEGSYATSAEGTQRIVEFREMVKGLSDAGLRVVMDVVYNHTNSSGQNEKSVLDKIVPGYYHRLNGDGNIERSSCCENTASEHNMMEKLLIDSAVVWATQYKVDGFRFDLMGHHMKRNMMNLRQRLNGLTLPTDGVDGARIYIYGEAWNFGEVADNARGENAIQRNMAGTGIGSFNDRIRDGARGGGPFSGLQEQGFLTGLWYDPNATNQGSTAQQRDQLLQRMDWIRVSLAGALASYTFVDRFGNAVQAGDVDYNGQRAGYTADPQEIINYIEAHDNETLFDAIQLKAPLGASLSDRVRMQNLGMSLVGLAQGIPFFHAGSELLRSKSLDRNSYNSGDWFNRLDFTYSSNNWGVGLPPAGDNQANWPLFRPLLADPALRPLGNNIGDANRHFREVLSIRRSSRLFRLRSAAEINGHLRFHNTGPAQIPAVLVMSVSDDTGSIDRAWKLAVVVFNADDNASSLPLHEFSGRSLSLHPLQLASADPIVHFSAFNSATAVFSVPGRTTAVFMERRSFGDQVNLLNGDVDRLVSGNTKPLHAKLEAAMASLSAGNTNAAANQLRAFINEVESMMRSGRLSADAGAALIAEANAILAQMK